MYLFMPVLVVLTHFKGREGEPDDKWEVVFPSFDESKSPSITLKSKV